MGSNIKLKAADGHEFAAYRADPAGAAKGGLVVIQEIFGLNAHIRSIADKWAKEGYLVVAPAVQERAEPGFEVGYTPPDVERGKAVRAKVKNEDALKDIKAALDYLKAQGQKKVGVVGFCWGGSLAWLSATDLDGIAVSVAYYGGEIAANAGKKAKCPVMFHFGEKDAGIPLDKVEIVKAKQPDHPLHIYPGAGHGFSCDARGSFHPESAALAFDRTKAYLSKHMG
jgi:carboxymethylenebutenolidase